MFNCVPSFFGGSVWAWTGPRMLTPYHQRYESCLTFSPYFHSECELPIRENKTLGRLYAEVKAHTLIKYLTDRPHYMRQQNCESKVGNSAALGPLRERCSSCSVSQAILNTLHTTPAAVISSCFMGTWPLLAVFLRGMSWSDLKSPSEQTEALWSAQASGKDLL